MAFLTSYARQNRKVGQLYKTQVRPHLHCLQLCIEGCRPNARNGTIESGQRKPGKHSGPKGPYECGMMATRLLLLDK